MCSCLLTKRFWIDALVKIDPQHAGKKRDGGRERQEQYGGPEDDFGDPPSGQEPNQCCDWPQDQDAQGKTEIHGAQKITRFAFELQIADGAALAHLRKSAKDGGLKNSADAAAGTALLENACQC